MISRDITRRPSLSAAKPLCIKGHCRRYINAVLSYLIYLIKYMIIMCISHHIVSYHISLYYFIL